MLKYTNTDIVFQEIPDEVTLAVNLSGCPCRCPGCHSPQLWGDIGEPLTRLKERHPNLKTAWYSGRTLLAKEVDLNNLDYVKLGPYLAHLGPLKSPKTNQRLYLVQHRRNTEPGNILHDLTPRFWRNKTPNKD